MEGSEAKVMSLIGDDDASLLQEKTQKKDDFQ
jgi:hypothetical protein